MVSINGIEKNRGLIELKPLKAATVETLKIEFFKQELEGGCKEFQSLAERVSTLKTLKEDMINGKLNNERIKAVFKCIGAALLTGLLVVGAIAIFPVLGPTYLGGMIPMFPIGGFVFLGYSFKETFDLFTISKKGIEKELNDISERNLSEGHLRHLEKIIERIPQEISSLEGEKAQTYERIVEKEEIGSEPVLLKETYTKLEDRIKNLKEAEIDLKRFQEEVRVAFFDRT